MDRTASDRTQYRVRRVDAPPSLDAGAGEGLWSGAAVAAIANFHPSSSEHRPQSQVRMLHDGTSLYIQFHVAADRFVRSIHTAYQDAVCQDSCVEFFVQPKPEGGYFNFELNCGGAMLLMYIEDPTLIGGAMRRFS